MQTTLCFDFGNTRLKCAIFENETLKDVVILNDTNVETILQFLRQHKATHSILSSVVNHPPEIEKVLASETIFHKLDHTSKLPFTTPVGKPETIGADRLALIAAAVKLYPGKHNLVIGLGSCITYNFINKFHEFLVVIIFFNFGILHFTL